MTSGIALTAAFTAASRRGSIRETAVAAGVAIAAGLVTAATGKVAKDSARDVFGRAPAGEMELPPYFAKLFDEQKPEGPK
jgi:hypothetical protein